MIVRPAQKAEAQRAGTRGQNPAAPLWTSYGSIGSRETVPNPLDPYAIIDEWCRRQYAELGLKLLCQAGQLPWWSLRWRWRMTRDGKRLLREARRLGWTEDELPERPCG